ncbi:MAG: hypothetical protein ACTSQY_00795 [Candidatus Odinarchaeia archaeon]
MKNIFEELKKENLKNFLKQNRNILCFIKKSRFIKQDNIYIYKFRVFPRFRTLVIHEKDYEKINDDLTNIDVRSSKSNKSFIIKAGNKALVYFLTNYIQLISKCKALEHVSMPYVGYDLCAISIDVKAFKHKHIMFSLNDYFKYNNT